MPFQRPCLCRFSNVGHAVPAPLLMPLQQCGVYRSSALLMPLQQCGGYRSSAPANAAPAVWGMPFLYLSFCRTNTLSYAVPAPPTTVLAPR